MKSAYKLGNSLPRTSGLCLLILLFLLAMSGCSADKELSLDDRLTPKAQQFLLTEGLAVDQSVHFDKRTGIGSELSPYLRNDGRVVVMPINGCGDMAYSLPAILTLGIIPAWCPVSANICYKGPGDCDNQYDKGNWYSEKYHDSNAGWLMIPAKALPGWGSDSDERAYDHYNKGLITLINKIAEKN